MTRIRLRFGIRCLLILIAIAGLLMLPLMAWRRSVAFSATARHHAKLEFGYVQSAVFNAIDHENPSLGLGEITLSEDEKWLEKQALDRDDHKLFDEAGLGSNNLGWSHRIADGSLTVYETTPGGATFIADSSIPMPDYLSLLKRALYHRSMKKKYQHAAKHPWLSVPPDPAPPEIVPERGVPVGSPVQP